MQEPIFRRDRLPRPPALVYGSPLDLANFADHVEKVCTELGVPPPGPTGDVVGRVSQRVILFQFHLKRIPRTMFVPVYGPHSHVTVFTYNIPGYQRRNKSGFQTTEKYLVENGVMETLETGVV